MFVHRTKRKSLPAFIMTVAYPFQIRKKLSKQRSIWFEMKGIEMQDEPKKEESSLEDEIYGDERTAPNTFAQPSIGVQAAIIARLLDTQEK
jgi:hypothetical protein